jgi:hypothetical protein
MGARRGGKGALAPPPGKSEKNEIQGINPAPSPLPAHFAPLEKFLRAPMPVSTYHI